MAYGDYDCALKAPAKFYVNLLTSSHLENHFREKSL
jgi:hypothetical protein